MNAIIGCRCEKREFDCKGPHGIKNRNSKGIEALNLLTMHNMLATSTFFFINITLLRRASMVKTHLIILIIGFQIQ